MIYAGTGHRPESLALGIDAYSSDLRMKLLRFAMDVVEEIEPTTIVSGMALGWDQALAMTAVTAGIPLIAAVPFPDQHKRWPDDAQDRYKMLLERADKIHTVRDSFSRSAYQERNVWMVKNCNHILALHNGVSRGGTYNCIKC